MGKMINRHQQTKSTFSKSLFWLGSAQVIGRIVRLASSIILARLFTPEIFGQVAIILTCFELICTPTRRITSASLIKMNDTELAASLTNANKINWLASIAAFVAMSLLSWPLAYYHQDTILIAPMILMATSYLLLPLGLRHAAVNLRANRMRIVGRAVLWQTIADGLLTATLALLGLGIWAIILPKVLVIFIWMGIHRYKNPLPEAPNQQQSDIPHTQKTQVADPKESTVQSLYQMLSFGSMVGLSDLSIALRQNIDYLLIGYFLGLEALGIYFFAFNTSLGISLGIIQSYGTALYSHLCGAQKSQQQLPVSKELKTRYSQSLSLILKIAIPVIALQSLLSPFYLPLIYGDKWIEAGALPIFILLCLSGLVRPIGEAASQLLISINKSRLNLSMNLGFTLLLAITIAICSQWGLTAVAAGILVIHLICMPTLNLYIQLFVLKTTVTGTQSEDRNNSKRFNQEVPHDA
ncbi:oligosaccharide flippase family protein [Shewanella sp. D64]|uniref:oligosaccharide flippase family protein n=1 Tax=unclassified Shewanella TaxID=196818 RepID=UPI0022BA19F5|nr:MULTISPECIES: oligosaccharide flippase family protein [unclassified Shewanella]MEC4727762.1 oligosaccharide flippase family protein [Shewanella sp. D64]MEC4737525.1 oligosaccharide flippase family protein [Shewanella sp. E94]WBJ97334.1 oligosaccharide flippase family protein [Shewanella sp. MTB7]